jgi:hypothetical protein
MKVLHFFDPVRKKGKFFMILILTFPEKMLLAKLGGFDKAIGTEGWIESEALVGKLKFPDKEAYVFFDRRERLDYIYLSLAEELGWKAKIKNIDSIPTHAELLANEHVFADAGKLNLYIDHELPLRDQRRRMLWGTYREIGPADYEKFWAECRGAQRYVRAVFRTSDVIVTRGHFQSGYALLQRYLNEQEGFSLKTNVLDAESYPTLLLKSVL